MLGNGAGSSLGGDDGSSVDGGSLIVSPLLHLLSLEEQTHRMLDALGDAMKSLNSVHPNVPGISLSN